MAKYQVAWNSVHTGVEVRNMPMTYAEAKMVYDLAKDNPHKDLTPPRLVEAEIQDAD